MNKRRKKITYGLGGNYMKKLFTKILCFVLSIACVFTATACGDNKNQGEKIDETKTQIFVGLVSNGYGKSWLEAAESRFEEKYADYQGENGKQGVQIIIDNVAYGGTLISSIQNVRAQVIFTGETVLSNWASAGHMVNIDSMVKSSLSTLTDGKETGSIEDKMTEDVQALYKYNGQYYALPYVTSSFGLSYDKDMFARNNIYLAAADPDFGDYSASGDAVGGYDFVDGQMFTVKSSGPDGVAGTEDDGLPATYDQFFAVCAEIKTVTGVNPILWGGRVEDYIKSFLGALQENAAGPEFESLKRTLDDNNVVEFVTGYTDLNGNNKPDVGELKKENTVENITAQTPQYLWQHESFFYALYFLEEIIDRGYVHSGSWDNTLSHLGAQEYFLKGTIENPPRGFDKVAMLVEGSYWENEATLYFNAMGTNNEAHKKENRNLGWMPLPHPMTDEEFKTAVENDAVPNATYNVMDTALGFVNPHTTKDSKQQQLAVDFLQFMYTEEALQDFTVETSLTRPMSYSLENRWDEMTEFGKSYVKHFQSANLVAGAKCDFTNANSIILSSYDNFYTNGIAKEKLPSRVFKDGDRTAWQYFTGMPTYYQGYSWIRK